MVTSAFGDPDDTVDVSAPIPRQVPAGVSRLGGALSWPLRYARRVATTDILIICLAVIGASLLRFGASNADLPRDIHLVRLETDYSSISVALILVWGFALSVFRSRDARIVGAGADEYRQVTLATLATFGLAAIVFYLTKVDIARGYVLIALPLGLVALPFARWVWRQRLIARRRQGLDSFRVLLVGSTEATRMIANDLQRTYGAGYRVIAAVVPDGQYSAMTLEPDLQAASPVDNGVKGTAHTRTGRSTGSLGGARIPVFTDLDVIDEMMSARQADTLVIASTDKLPPQRIREISWSLAPGQDLVMVPSLTDVGGPRIHLRPVAGLPLMHVEMPQYQGTQVFLKRLLDLVGSAALITVLSPVLAAAAMAVRLGSPGPVLFRQERVGVGGEPFQMLKFRSMVVDAEALLPELLEGERDAGNDVLFKMQDDPRITPVGRLLRRWSLDELPQLFNVFAGSMSLVGPRPPLPRETSSYEWHVHRKFLVKPGITGLWQVNGRSALSWEESVRLDLYYVENWSLIGDLVILWRTLKAVVGKDGAY